MLPDILPVAKKHKLSFYHRSLEREEVLAKCPFCQEDSKPGKERKYYLSLNTVDQVYKCWFCGEAGGVFRFISLLEGVPEQDVIERYREKKGSTYKPHPAERLSVSQYRLMGYKEKPDFVGLRDTNIDLYKRKRQECWRDWQEFVKAEKRFAYQMLVVGIYGGRYQKVVQEIREREIEIGAELLKPVLRIYSLPQRPEWTEQAEAFALHVANPKKYPYPSTDKRMRDAQ